MSAAIANLVDAAGEVSTAIDLAKLCQCAIERDDSESRRTVWGGLDVLIARLDGLMAWLDGEAQRQSTPEPAKPKKARVRK